MSSLPDLLLLLVLLTDLYVLSTSRLAACIRASAFQGALLAGLLASLHAGEESGAVRTAVAAVAILVLKAIVIPGLLLRAARRADVQREVAPYVSLHASVLLGALLAAAAFWMARALPLPATARTPLLVPVALATLFIGFLVLVSRDKAITQVVGYLLLENGVFAFGLGLVPTLPFVVELALLLDLLVGVFVMGITIHHISREFDHIDVDELASLRD